jgi:hypothetical protein
MNLNMFANDLSIGNAGLFSLLNTDGRKLVVYKIRNLVELILAVLMHGNPSQIYLKGLLEIATDLAECLLLGDNSLFPTVRRDATFIGILDKFNKLQRTEEAHTQALINRACNVEAPEESCCLPTHISTAKP